MQRKRLSLLVILLLSLQTAAVRADKVDDYVKAEMQKQRIPGLSLAVVKEGKVIKAEGYGLANVEHNVPARPETVYKIASVSKQFIASGIMMLVQEGKIGLDDKVGKYLDGTPESWNGVTIRHLLTHTSGIVREGPAFDPFKDQKDFDVIKSAYPLPLRFKTGEYVAVRPSGAFLSTVLDLAKWDAALYTDAILKQATREQMWTPVKLNSGATHPYGFGFSLEPMGNHRQVSHGGSLPGFRSHFSRLPDDKLSIIVLTNCGSASPEAIVRGVAAFYLSDLDASLAK